MEKLSYERIMLISLLHVSEVTRFILKNKKEELPLLIYPKANVGYFIVVQLEELSLDEVGQIPQDLLYLLRLYHLNDCFYLDLDIEYPHEDANLFTLYD